jgi:DNA-binding MarR family transcriptional regulator
MSITQLFNGLCPVLRQPSRLAICLALRDAGSLLFIDIKDRAGLTDNNLGDHLAALEETGYITLKKKIFGRYPRTTVQLTASGQRALARHIDWIEQLLRCCRQQGGPHAKN